MISFIMLAKNESKRIRQGIDSLISSKYEKFELIVIDDNSDDNTFDLVKNYSVKDKRIRIFKNKFIGKVKGTNYGYKLSSGKLIKFIDADDILLPEFFFEIKNISSGFSHCHAATIVTNELKSITKYIINPSIVYRDPIEITSKLISLPKWCWTFSREVADKIFPIPEGMPIEDLWMSLRAKEFSKKILISKKSLYLYRQHEGQDYGGILNYNYELVKLRSERSLKAIKVLNNMIAYKNVNFSYLEKYLNILINRSNISMILSSGLLIKDIFKAILILYFPRLASYSTVLKWKIDSYL